MKYTERAKFHETYEKTTDKMENQLIFYMCKHKNIPDWIWNGLLLWLATVSSA